MKFLLTLLVAAAFVGGLATDGIAGGDKGASASGTVSGSGSVSVSPSGQDTSKSGQDATKSGQDSGSASPATGGQDKSTAGQDKSGAASPATGGQDKASGTLSAPASMDDCKDDGWKQFGDRFKNQGECVSSITSSSDKKQ